MSAERYEIFDDGPCIRIVSPDSTISTIVGRPVGYHIDDAIIGAIRQQARDIAALKDALADEVTANEAFRKAGGARDDEDMPTFCARLIAERDAYRGQLFDCEFALKIEHDLSRERRADLAAAVAERDAVRRRAQDLFECAMKTIPADWRPGYAWADDGVMNILAEYVGEIQSGRDTLRARLAAIDGAPTLCWQDVHDPSDLYWRRPNPAQVDTRELIARPAKDQA